ncbi:hypothetical protein CRG98_006642 [Punica granatum]|uniref:Uncharacterized protein n=1 Tax=Punica granatum TaxID=22663 RepID=A0A2I0KWU9_PUNGR|nr:hypothetical protein CRG98_006642 [Punica granatum]
MALDNASRNKASSLSSSNESSSGGFSHHRRSQFGGFPSLVSQSYIGIDEWLQPVISGQRGVPIEELVYYSLDKGVSE